jgi:hypothetical protein
LHRHSTHRTSTEMDFGKPVTCSRICSFEKSTEFQVNNYQVRMQKHMLRFVNLHVQVSLCGVQVEVQVVVWLVDGCQPLQCRVGIINGLMTCVSVSVSRILKLTYGWLIKSNPKWLMKCWIQYKCMLQRNERTCE